MTFFVRFHTNLDEAQPYVRGLDATRPMGVVPADGHELELELDNGKILPLRVVAVRWSQKAGPRVELHMAQHGMSIREWTEWFKRHSSEDPSRG